MQVVVLHFCCTATKTQQLVMPALAGFVNFTPDKDVPSLKDKVIFVTGGSVSLTTSCQKDY